MGLCSCLASCLAWGIQHWSLLTVGWSWVLALRWGSLGDLLLIDIMCDWEVSGGPMSWTRLSHLRGSGLTPGQSTKTLSATRPGTWGFSCLLGSLRSSASVPYVFCRSCSKCRCIFDVFVGRNVISKSYSSTILKVLVCLLTFFQCSVAAGSENVSLKTWLYIQLFLKWPLGGSTVTCLHSDWLIAPWSYSISNLLEGNYIHVTCLICG